MTTSIDIQSKFFDLIRIVWAELLSRKTSISLNQFLRSYFLGVEMFSRTTPVLMSGENIFRNWLKTAVFKAFYPLFDINTTVSTWNETSIWMSGGILQLLFNGLSAWE